jgi:hypothetical protein
MAVPIHRRHLRHGRFERLRHSEGFAAYLARQDARLTSSATGKAVTADYVALVYASGLLTVGGQPTDTQTVTIGARVYTFQDTLTNVAGNVKIGASATATRDNLVAAITAGAGSGTAYAAATTVHPTVTAVAAGANITVTALTGGTEGNAIATTDTASNYGFGAVTLEGGVDEVITPSFSATTHGITTGEGPYLFTTSGTLPEPFASDGAGSLYWVINESASKLQLARSREAAINGEAIDLTGGGTGTHTLTKAMTSQGIFEMLKVNSTDRLNAATDVDALT